MGNDRVKSSFNRTNERHRKQKTVHHSIIGRFPGIQKESASNVSIFGKVDWRKWWTTHSVDSTIHLYIDESKWKIIIYNLRGFTFLISCTVQYRIYCLLTIMTNPRLTQFYADEIMIQEMRYSVVSTHSVDSTISLTHWWVEMKDNNLYNLRGFTFLISFTVQYRIYCLLTIMTDPRLTQFYSDEIMIQEVRYSVVLSS